MNYFDELASIISKEVEGVSSKEISVHLEIPPKKEMGDFAFPCFKLAKIYKKSPNEIASELAPKIKSEGFIARTEANGGYVNIFLDSKALASSVLGKVMEEKEEYYKQPANNKSITIDYSSPNIAKPFHIGHIRSTVIGACLVKLLRYKGYTVYGINHLGDYGTQFGKLIVAYKKWGDREVIKADPINELLKLYVHFHTEAEKDPSLDDEARGWFTKLENGDEEAKELWQFFRDESLKEFNIVYKMLGIEFESLAGESFYSDKMDVPLKRLEEKNLTVEGDKGSKIVDLEEFNMPPAMVQKSDGSTLYMTRDLATAMYRKSHYDFYKNLYVVGNQQSLYFKQLFKVLELMDLDWYKDCVHVEFGMVSLEGGQTLSTRKGNVVFLEDVLKSAVKRSREIIEEKNPNLKDKDKLAEDIGVGAVVFQELSSSRTKDYSFSIDRTLSFDGETGPYVQYTHARACSVIRKSEGFDFSSASLESLSDNEEAMDIIKVMATYKDVLDKVEERYEPHHITRYLLDLCSAYNAFYHHNPILTAEDEVKKDRLYLTLATTYAIRSALSILGMKAPEEM